MRRWSLVLVLLCALSFALSGCGTYRAPVIPPQGFLITKISAPLSINYDKTPVCSKQGSATALYFHDFLFTGLAFAWGKADLHEAVANGNLSTVEYADYDRLLILRAFGKFTVRAYGN